MKVSQWIKGHFALIIGLTLFFSSASVFSAMNLSFGVNLPGGCFQSGQKFPASSNFDYYHSKNQNIIRLGFLWERMQSTLNGPLVASNLAKMDAAVSLASARGMKVILDMHNQAKFNGTLINSGAVTYAAYKDVWTKLAAHYSGNSAIYGYGIMNEPDVALTSANWTTAAQNAINGIRTVDTTHTILVAWWHWYYQAPNTDPQNNLAYEAHFYFDANNSGVYSNSYDVEGAYPMRGVERADAFLNWCIGNKAKGFMGEYGIPKTDSRWTVVLNNFMQYMKDNGISGTYWAGGWSDTYKLCSDPINGVDSQQMNIMKNYTASTYAGNYTGEVFNYTGSTTTGNLALGKKVFSSGDDYTASGGGRWTLIDGSDATGWGSLSVQKGRPAWIAIDLGQNCSVNKFIVKHKSWQPCKDFKIQSSMDGLNFTDRVTVIGNTKTITTNNIVSVSARYFRILVTNPGNDNITRIMEFQIMGNGVVNQLPSVNITAPANNAVYSSGDVISIAANATDSDGSISKVEFYRGSTLLGTDTTSPYSFTWSTGTASGTYSFTAKAYDNAGATTTSSAINITVNASSAVNLALNKPVTYSAQYNSSNRAASKTVDGDSLTCWASLGVLPAWIIVDLGQSCTITNFVINHYGNINDTANFQIHGSTSGSSYTTLVSVLSNKSHITKHTITPTAMRYVRLYITKATSNPNGDTMARIYEFKVFGCVGTSGAQVFTGMITTVDPEPSDNILAAVPVVAKRGGSIRFYGADARAEQIKIYSATGILINALPLQNGSAEWNLKNSAGNTVSPGIYLGTAMNNGKITTVKVGIK